MNGRRLSRAIVLLSVCLSLFVRMQELSAEETLARTTESDVWQAIFLGNQRIGYAHSHSELVKSSAGKQWRETETHSYSTFKRFGQSITIRTKLTTTETLDGQLLAFRYSQHAPPSAEKSTLGKVADGKLTLTNTIAGKTTTQEMGWAADIKSPNYQDRMLMSRKNLKAGETLTLKTFLPDFNKVTTVTLKVGELQDVALFGNKKEKLRIVEMSQSAIPGVTTTLYLNATGDSIKTSTRMLGTQMTTWQVPKTVALKSVEGAELDIAVRTLVKVKPIPNAHTTKKIVYRITLPEGDPGKVLISDKTQQVKKLNEHQVELTVLARPLPNSAAAGKTRADYLSPTRFLEADNPNVKAHAESAANRATDAAVISKNMEQYVHRVLTQKNFSTALATAAEVATSLEGDCTEHAVLLAAMLRAKGIPSRVVAGLVYVNRLEGFGGHMWTEVNLGGEWIPLDATIGRGGIAAGHIKLSQSSFAEDAPTPASLFLPLIPLIGKLKIEVVSTE